MNDEVNPYLENLKFDIQYSICQFETLFLKIIMICILMFMGSFFCDNGDSCIECHKISSPNIVKEYRGSIHAQIDLNCLSCHNGNSNAMDEKKAHTAVDFKGKFSRKEITELCNSCHSNYEII